MRKILGILFLTAFIAGCDSRDNVFDCTEDFPETDCLAEDLSDSCLGFFCDTEPPTSVIALFQSCTATDCSTLDCGNITFAELERSEDGTITSEVFLDDQDLGMAECGFFQE